MSQTKPPKVNERTFDNYDWTQTSCLPGMLEPVATSGLAGSVPKLMCDDEEELSVPEGRSNDGYSSENNIKTDWNERTTEAHHPSRPVPAAQNAHDNPYAAEDGSVDDAVYDIMDEEYPTFPQAPPPPQLPRPESDGRPAAEP